MNAAGVDAVADRLIEAYDQRQSVEPLTSADPEFQPGSAYAVQRAIHARRLAGGWEAVGRKIAFTNRELWARYGVDQPLWAHMYGNTVHRVPAGRAQLAASRFVRPRIEPEVVFGLNGPVPPDGDARTVLERVDWIAAGFEIVQCHFPGWKFRAADCIAAFGLHGALVIGPAVAVDSPQRDRLAERLPEFELLLARDGAVVDRGTGDRVLGSPALALRHLAGVLAAQPEAPPLEPGEIVTTGTITDAWPIAAGECWRSDYGDLDLPGIELEITP
jgi:2-keto-4-pentenoate hydratase